jgi:hypothetical protein
VDVTLNEEESAVLQRALQTYLSELRSEISDTDDRQFKAGLKHEREVLERVAERLEATKGRSELRDSEGREVVRVVTYWWAEETY